MYGFSDWLSPTVAAYSCPKSSVEYYGLKVKIKSAYKRFENHLNLLYVWHTHGDLKRTFSGIEFSCFIRQQQNDKLTAYQ